MRFKKNHQTQVAFIFGIGGGSDMASAQLVAMWAKYTEYALFTSFRPILTADGVVNYDETVRKYTGMPYSSNGKIHGGHPQYTLWRVCDDGDGSSPTFYHSELDNMFGILVPPVTCTDAFADCCSAVRSLVSSLDPDWFNREIVAVDTGGDCLRGHIPGMGDRDISHLYSGEVDTRDRDTLIMLSKIFQVGRIRTIILGPGSDGETTNAGLREGLVCLRENTSKVTLIKQGLMSEFFEFFPSVPEWNDPVPGSTISNIRRAKGDGLVEIHRRGVLVGFVEKSFLDSFWIVEICIETKKI